MKFLPCEENGHPLRCAAYPLHRLWHGESHEAKSDPLFLTCHNNKKPQTPASEKVKNESNPISHCKINRKNFQHYLVPFKVKCRTKNIIVKKNVCINECRNSKHRVETYRI